MIRAIFLEDFSGKYEKTKLRKDEWVYKKTGFSVSGEVRIMMT